MLSLRICFSLTIVAAVFAGECPKRWKYYSGHCYFFSKTKLNWHGAKEDCENKSGYLATVMSAKEHDYLVHQLIYKGLQKTDIWIGGSDLVKEKVWKWESTAEIFGFAKWIPRQPDNHQSREDCLSMWHSHNFNWNDADCNYKTNYICKKDEECHQSCCDAKK